MSTLYDCSLLFCSLPRCRHANLTWESSRTFPRVFNAITKCLFVSLSCLCGPWNDWFCSIWSCCQDRNRCLQASPSSLSGNYNHDRSVPLRLFSSLFLLSFLPSLLALVSFTQKDESLLWMSRKLRRWNLLQYDIACKCIDSSELSSCLSNMREDLEVSS